MDATWLTGVLNFEESKWDFLTEMLMMYVSPLLHWSLLFFCIIVSAFYLIYVDYFGFKEKIHHYTLLDGEMIIDTMPDSQKQERRYLIYDMMAINHVSVIEVWFMYLLMIKVLLMEETLRLYVVQPINVAWIHLDLLNFVKLLVWLIVLTSSIAMHNLQALMCLLT